MMVTGNGRNRKWSEPEMVGTGNDRNRNIGEYRPKNVRCLPVFHGTGVSSQHDGTHCENSL